MATLATIWSLAKPLYGHDKLCRVSEQAYRTLRFIRFCGSNGIIPWILRCFFEKSSTEVKSYFPRNKPYTTWNWIWHVEHMPDSPRRSEIDGAIKSQCCVKFQSREEMTLWEYITWWCSPDCRRRDIHYLLGYCRRTSFCMPRQFYNRHAQTEHAHTLGSLQWFMSAVT
jgi:hypothetical protein